MKQRDKPIEGMRFGRRGVSFEPLPLAGSVEVHMDGDNELDEVFATHACVHLERMDEGAWSLIISNGASDGPQLHVWLTAKKPGKTTVNGRAEWNP